DLPSCPPGRSVLPIVGPTAQPSKGGRGQPKRCCVMDSRLFRLAAMAVLASTGAACAPVTTYSGFSSNFNNNDIPQPQVGVDTKETVQQRFGTPSTTAVFDQTAWYYVSAAQEQVAFYAPRTTERHVMVVRFNGDTVSAVDNYGIER